MDVYLCVFIGGGEQSYVCVAVCMYLPGSALNFG